MAKILLVEDDVNYARAVTGWLGAEKFIVDHVETCEDALQLLSNFGYDIVILDWELGDGSGTNVCERYRNSGGSAPIIFLTGREDFASRVEGLDTGADDYLVKPVDRLELIARIRVLLRRPSGTELSIIEASGVKLELDTRTAIVHGKRISLSKQESAILEYLIQNCDRSVSAKELLASAWASPGERSENTVRSSVRMLRKKFTSEGLECPIKTTDWSGYMVVSQ